MRTYVTTVSFALAFSVCVVVSGCSGGSNGSGGGTTPTPPPTPAASLTVTSIAPATIAAGASSLTLTVNGTGFTSTTAVQVGGVAEPTTFVSSTQVTVALTAAQLTSGGMLTVVAANGAATSGTTGTSVNLEVDNPLPTITQVAPNSLLAGAAGVNITVTGTGFVPSTAIQIGGAGRATSYVSATQVNVQLTAADLAAAGSLSLTAVNPTPKGGTSAAAAVAVNNPVPGGVMNLAPSVVTSGATTPTTVTVTGSGFVPTSMVQVGGSSRSTTYVSATQLTFQLTVADQAAAATLAVTIVNPAPGGGISRTLVLTVAVATPIPVITSLAPATFVAGSGDSTIAVYGSNLSSSVPTTGSLVRQLYSTVQWNGTALTTSLYTNYLNNIPTSYLMATVPAALLAKIGTASVTVTSPTATPALSNALSVSITDPPAPTLTSILPNSGPINTAAKITLSGAGFTANSTVAYNGTSLPATFISTSSLTVTLPASSVALPGNGSFTVTTPAPGGGTSAAMVYTAYIQIANNSMIYNPVDGLFYVSVPSAAGLPYGNSVVSVDPATGALGTPIYVGSEPNKLAITSDGKYLWVGLDGASAVRKVDLTGGVAGLQFTLGGNTGIYANPGTALALAALPGATDSVVVSATNEFSNLALAIYDSGVVRGGSSSTNNAYNSAYSLLVDGTRGEVYAGSQNAYYTYTYGSTGLTLKASSTSGTYASTSSDEMQIAGGKLYTDFGGVYDAESGSLLGTLYSSGTTKAGGPTGVDTSLGEAFVLDNSTNSYGTYNQIQAFDTSTYNQKGVTTIPVNVTAGNYGLTSASRLMRWGVNGLAFRTSAGVYSLRSNLVKDLSGVSADLGVTVSAAGSNATGAISTYVATVTNGGPSAATNVTLAAYVPSTGSLVSIVPSVGSCSTTNGVTCDLGGLANGASATVTLVVTQTTAGTGTLTVAASGSENDPVLTNNQATASATISGSTYSLPPGLVSISPASVLSGATDTTITVTGNDFSSGSTVQLSGVALATSYVSGTTLKATVPSANLTTLGWAPVTVKTPAPGGGVSGALPLTVYSVITLGVNHILYDPYSRKIMASVGSGSSAVTGNSIVAITPETASVGTPVNIGSQPTSMSLTDDGQVLYTVLSGSESVARFNMLTQTADFTYAVPNNNSFVGGISLRGVAAQPGTENTVALDIASFTGNAIYDFDPVAKTASIRGQASGPYSGSCIQFLDAGNLLAFDTDTSGATLDHYKVTSAGFTYYNYSQYTSSTLNHFGCFKLSGGLAFAINGGVANPATSPAVQLGVFGLPSGYSTFGGGNNVAPDTSLQRTFFAVNSASSGYSSTIDSIESFDNNTYLPTGNLPLGFAATEGSSTSYSVNDLVRWGQDGLAVLTSGGHVYLLRGPVVAPQLLNINTAATLTASSAATIAHGAGNTMLTLTGGNFVPGVAVTWNGSYRTTTIVDAAHVTVAIPAVDLVTMGTGSLVATNPGAPASGVLTVTIQ